MLDPDFCHMDSSAPHQAPDTFRMSAKSVVNTCQKLILQIEDSYNCNSPELSDAVGVAIASLESFLSVLESKTLEHFDGLAAEVTPSHNKELRDVAADASVHH